MRPGDSAWPSSAGAATSARAMAVVSRRAPTRAASAPTSASPPAIAVTMPKRVENAPGSLSQLQRRSERDDEQHGRQDPGEAAVGSPRALRIVEQVGQRESHPGQSRREEDADEEQPAPDRQARVGLRGLADRRRDAGRLDADAERQRASLEVSVIGRDLPEDAVDAARHVGRQLDRENLAAGLQMRRGRSGRRSVLAFHARRDPPRRRPRRRRTWRVRVPWRPQRPGKERSAPAARVQRPHSEKRRRQRAEGRRGRTRTRSSRSCDTYYLSCRQAKNHLYDVAVNRARGGLKWVSSRRAGLLRCWSASSPRPCSSQLRHRPPP